MVRLVNRAIRRMATNHHGEQARQRSKQRADLRDLDFFSTCQAYPDDVTHPLVAPATVDLGLSGAQIIQAFGEYWITDTAAEGDEQLLESTGETLPEFLDQVASWEHGDAKDLCHVCLSPPADVPAGHPDSARARE